MGCEWFTEGAVSLEKRVYYVVDGGSQSFLPDVMDTGFDYQTEDRSTLCKKRCSLSSAALGVPQVVGLLRLSEAEQCLENGMVSPITNLLQLVASSA